MAQQLQTGSMRDRIQAALAFEAHTVKSGVREEALLPLHYLLLRGGAVMPAQAGIRWMRQQCAYLWMPACAGMTRPWQQQRP